MKEKCVICKSETPYDITTHIDERIGYVEGVGQLCRRCYNSEDDDYVKAISIPIDLIRTTPNDMELGEIIRSIYFRTKN
jgi:hypothetical protein